MPNYDATPDAPAEQTPNQVVAYTFDFTNQLAGAAITAASVRVVDRATMQPLANQDTYVPPADVTIIAGSGGAATAIQIVVSQPPLGARWVIAVLGTAGPQTYEIDMELEVPTGTLLGWATYRDVRTALDPTLTAEELPDSTIRLDLYAGRAERWVQSLDPQWQQRTPAQQQGEARAAALYCAGLLALAWPVMRSERFGDYTYSRDLPASNAGLGGLTAAEGRQRRLFAEALAALTLALGGAVTTNLVLPERATMFAVSSGTRMRAPLAPSPAWPASDGTPS